ncbi:MAG: FAD-dependent oxidoreductase [Henriciella sp.]|uniref:FAD-dependent oxidoreductase n=1 Tax=Henriciella sp. TaxID=1968823 RepID=UPI003C78FBA7
MLDRRSVLLGMSGGLLAACTTTGRPRLSDYEASSAPFYPVDVRPERIKEILVGLRPGRDGGFRLEAEPFGDKIIVHNYGHEGDGVTLSWGCGTLAAEKVLETGEDDIAVIGAGAQGLTTALILARHGKKVTVYAEKFHPNVTSSIAGAIILTASSYGDVDLDTVARVNALAHTGFDAYENRPGTGVTRVRHHYLNRRRQDMARPDEKTLLGCPFGDMTRPTMIDMSLYLPYLMQEARVAGVAFYTETFRTPADLIALGQPVIVNCTGLGAGALFDDEAVHPVWGQLVRLHPQPEIDYSYVAPGNDGQLYMFPRQTSIVLGGTRRRDVWPLEPDPAETARLLLQHGKLAARARQILPLQVAA